MIRMSHEVTEDKRFGYRDSCAEDSLVLGLFSCLVLLLLVGASAFDGIWWLLEAIPICVFLLGIVNITFSVVCLNQIWSPFTLYTFIWLILVPLFSGGFPLMDQMTAFQWRLSLIMDISFYAAFSVVTLLVPKVDKKEHAKSEPFSLTRSQFAMAVGMIVVSSLATVIDALLFGGFVSSSDAVYEERYRDSFPGFSLLRELGPLGVALISFDGRRRNSALFFFLLVVVLLGCYTRGVRFGIVVTLFMVVAGYMSDGLSWKKVLGLLVAAIAVVLIFFAIAYLRDIDETQALYFISTGKYTGDPAYLAHTEIARYFGMTQRLVEEYFAEYAGGETALLYTLTPILNILQLDVFSLPVNLSIYGYNAVSMIAYAYLDAGMLWPVLTFCWSAAMVSAFRYSQLRSTLISQYLGAASMLCIALSFYTYIHALTYWVLLFPLLLMLVSNGRKNRNETITRELEVE